MILHLLALERYAVFVSLFCMVNATSLPEPELDTYAADTTFEFFSNSCLHSSPSQGMADENNSVSAVFHIILHLTDKIVFGVVNAPTIIAATAAKPSGY
jgi:hypothetical protein